MQTFLPVKDYEKSAKMLDRLRLGKQRVECMQILKALLEGGGWANHACTKMWRGYEPALVLYSRAVCNEWVLRGYKDTCLGKINDMAARNGITDVDLKYAETPWWLGKKKLHHSHRANLMRKDPEHYGKIFGAKYARMEGYWWPKGKEAAPVMEEE